MHERIAACLVLLAGTGCGANISAWSAPTPGRDVVARREPVPAGIEVIPTVHQQSVLVRERDLCSFREQHVESGVETRSVQVGSGLDVLGYALIAAAVPVAIGGGLASAAANNDDTLRPPESSRIALTILGAGALFGTGLGLAVAFPKTRTEERTWERGFVTNNDAVAPCNDVTRPSRRQAFIVQFYGGGQPLVESTESTDAGGTYNGPLLQRLAALATWCDDLQAHVRFDLPQSVMQTTPADPSQRVSSGSTPLYIAGRGPRAPRSELGDDPRIASMAHACCLRTARRELAEGCEHTCGALLDVSPCMNLRDQCRMRAARSENRADNEGLCGNLFDECLVGRGSARATLDRCIARCVDDKTMCD